MDRTPLLPGRRGGRTFPALLAAAAGCFALCALAYLSHSERTVLATTVTQNCDGSVDITTTSMLPCAAGFLPPMAAPMYTSYAPIAAAMPPVAPMAPAVTYGAAMPTAPNVYQYPTVWSGDHVISAGQPEWAAEDAAQHALNLANWRIKLLQAKKVQAQLAKEVMSIGTSSVRTIGNRSVKRTRKIVKKTTKRSKKTSKKLSEQAQLAGIEKSVLTLAQETRKAIGALAGEVDTKGAGNSASNQKLDRILSQMKDINDEATDDNESAADDGAEDDSANDEESDDSDKAETDQ